MLMHLGVKKSLQEQIPRAGPISYLISKHLLCLAVVFSVLLLMSPPLGTNDFIFCCCHCKHLHPNYCLWLSYTELLFVAGREEGWVWAAPLSHESAKQILAPLAWNINENMTPVALPADTLGLTLGFKYPEGILAISSGEFGNANLILDELPQLL